MLTQLGGLWAYSTMQWLRHTITTSERHPLSDLVHVMAGGLPQGARQDLRRDLHPQETEARNASTNLGSRVRGYSRRCSGCLEVECSTLSSSNCGVLSSFESTPYSTASALSVSATPSPRCSKICDATCTAFSTSVLERSLPECIACTC